MSVEMILDAQTIVGESIVWDDRNGRLLWVDIVGKAIHAMTVATGDHKRWDTPDFVTSLGLCADGRVIVGLTKAICYWDGANGFEPFAQVEPDLPGNRLNEGVVGPDGAFWVGTMQNNIAPDGSAMDISDDTGRLYRCTSDGQVLPLSEDRFALTNTLVWPEDGGLITADTGKNEIYRYSYDPVSGHLTNRRTLVAGFDRGLPDGSTLDAEGYIWNCRVVGGGCLLRFDPNGRVDRVIDLPCSWPTSCAFGGSDMSTLYVTSARFTMEQSHLKAQPQEGALFAVRPGVAGRPSHRFG